MLYQFFTPCCGRSAFARRVTAFTCYALACDCLVASGECTKLGDGCLHGHGAAEGAAQEHVSPGQALSSTVRASQCVPAANRRSCHSCMPCAHSEDATAYFKVQLLCLQILGELSYPPHHSQFSQERQIPCCVLQCLWRCFHAQCFLDSLFAQTVALRPGGVHSGPRRIHKAHTFSALGMHVLLSVAFHVGHIDSVPVQ